MGSFYKEKCYPVLLDAQTAYFQDKAFASMSIGTGSSQLTMYDFYIFDSVNNQWKFRHDTYNNVGSFQGNWTFVANPPVFPSCIEADYQAFNLFRDVPEQQFLYVGFLFAAVFVGVFTSLKMFKHE